MAKNVRPIVQVVSHGLNCLDGVVAAACVAHFSAGYRVIAQFATNSDSDRALQQLKPLGNGPNEIWITDLSWRSEATATHLNQLAAQGVRIYWVDHHRSAIVRADGAEFAVQFADKVLSEKFSAARLTYDYLRRERPDREVSTIKGEEFFHIVELADDYDRWVNRFPEAHEWALAVQVLGSYESYRSITRLKRAALSPKLAAAAKAGRAALQESLARARDSLVEHHLADGLTLLAACCIGYTSEVAYELYRDRSRTLVALLDLRTGGVSLRRSPDCPIDLSHLATSFGGGGHPAAAGFRLPLLTRLPAEQLALTLSQKLSSSTQIR